MSQKNGQLQALVRELQARVAELERQVANLKGHSPQPPEKDWRRTIGMFAGNEGMKEIDRLGVQYREKLRQREKTKRARRVKAKT